MGPCQTTKDCQNAAKTIVKFLADMQIRVYEERERMKIEKQQKAIADAEAEELLKQEADAVDASKSDALTADQQKTKSKKEKKSKEKKLKSEAIQNSIQNAPVNASATAGCCVTFFKVVFLSTLIWILLALTLISSIVFYPDFYEKSVLAQMPPAFKPLAANFVKIVQNTINMKSLFT